jgi:hypothetical protein
MIVKVMKPSDKSTPAELQDIAISNQNIVGQIKHQLMLLKYQSGLDTRLALREVLQLERQTKSDLKRLMPHYVALWGINCQMARIAWNIIREWHHGATLSFCQLHIYIVWNCVKTLKNAGTGVRIC